MNKRFHASGLSRKSYRHVKAWRKLENKRQVVYSNPEPPPADYTEEEWEAIRMAHEARVGEPLRGASGGEAGCE